MASIGRNDWAAVDGYTRMSSERVTTFSYEYSHNVSTIDWTAKSNSTRCDAPGLRHCSFELWKSIVFFILALLVVISNIKVHLILILNLKVVKEIKHPNVLYSIHFSIISIRSSMHSPASFV